MKCPCNHCKYQVTQTELYVEKISNKKQLEGTFEFIHRGPYTDHTQQKLILLLAQGETPMSPILCRYEY